jgi:cyclophilin family peptidyl-prolyl cis-trans isomerase
MTRRSVLIAATACLAAAIVAPARHTRAQPTDTPVVVIETSKGVLAFETFPNETPVTVAHVLALVRARFYDGQRIHRAQPGFVVQFGDPQSRDLAKRELWGRGAAAASGKPVGVAELSTKHLHKAGAVGMAHMGDPSKADSQIYIALEARPDLDGRYLVIGQVIEGGDVPSQLQVGDDIRRVYVR